MVNKLLLGLSLRCPHCGQGHISYGILKVHELCEVCHVRFERKSGESVGASIVWVAVLPIISMIFYFILFAVNQDLSLIAQLGITMTFTAIIGVLGYRHARGVWIAVVELSEGLKTDAEMESGSL